MANWCILGVQVPESLTKFSAKRGSSAKTRKNKESLMMNPVEMARQQFQIAAKAGCDLGLRWLDRLEEEEKRHLKFITIVTSKGIYAYRFIMVVCREHNATQVKKRKLGVLYVEQQPKKIHEVRKPNKPTVVFTVRCLAVFFLSWSVSVLKLAKSRVSVLGKIWHSHRPKLTDYNPS
ncbi:hypothetical protein CFP56_017673 [Quercus suber]|uniref:Uncharacterized protein n=1 Tax=Quercus suber TaxID=58331 RepID=A0AAW0M2C6_QUESU